MNQMRSRFFLSVHAAAMHAPQYRDSTTIATKSEAYMLCIETFTRPVRRLAWVAKVSALELGGAS